jgi:hypothetical protein
MCEANVIVRVTPDFVEQVLKKYTRRLEDLEAKKRGVRKERITKEYICRTIILDMQNAGLI